MILVVCILHIHLWIYIYYRIVLVCCLNCWRAAWTPQQPSTMLRPMDRCCWMKQKFCRSLAWFMIVGVSSWLFWHILTGCCSCVYGFVYCTSPLSYVIVAIWFYRFFWIPHTFSIASWWYQRVSYGIMIHSLTPGSVGQESTGDGSGSRFVAAHAQGWGGVCGFMDVMFYFFCGKHQGESRCHIDKCPTNLSSNKFTIDTFWGQYSFRWSYVWLGIYM